MYQHHIKSIKTSYMLFFLFLFFFPCLSYANNTSSTPPLYQAGKIYLKIKDNSSVELGLPNSNSNPAKIETLFLQYGVTKIIKPFKVYAKPKFDRIYRITFDEQNLVEDFIRGLENIAYIQYAEKVPHYVAHELVPDDPSAQNGESYQLELINAYDAFELYPGDPTDNSAGSLIAIVDNAVLVTHEDLAENYIIGRDVADNDDDPNPPTNHGLFGHGTRVAGIACARTNNGIGVASIGWNNQLMAIKSAADIGSNNGESYYDEAIDGVAWAAANGAEVINMSWGGGAPSESDYNVLVEARDLGSILVSSAGNTSNSLPNFPGSYGEGETGEVWEIFDKHLVIAVAAIDPNGDRSWFSSFGSWVDVAAYGSNIYTCSSQDNVSYIDNRIGTSYAAPLVSGLLGMMKSYAPNATNEDLINCLLYSANSDIYNPLEHPDNISGSLGSGRIDALAALLCINPNCDDPLAVIFPSSPTICPNEDITLSSNDGIGYMWSTGEATQSINISQSGNYSVTVTFNGGCTASTSIDIDPALSSPFIIMTDLSGNIIDENPICVPENGFSYHLSAFWGNSYLWNNGSTISTYNPPNGFSVVTNALAPFLLDRSVNISGVGGCDGVDEVVSIQYEFIPTPEIAFTFEETSGFENDGWVCENENASVIINAVTEEAYNPTYMWSTGETTSFIAVTPSATTSYFVTITNEFGCINEKEVEVEVFPCPDNACACTSGNNAYDFGIDDGAVHNMSELSGIPPIGIITSNCISIRGKIRFDLNLNFFENSVIYLNPGAELIVPDGEVLSFVDCTLMGCDAMWKGITVETGGRLNFRNNIIRDAQYAITAHGESTLQILGSTFDRNFVGIYVPPPTAGSPNIFVNTINQADFGSATANFSGNQYLCTGNLKAPYAGQFPEPGNITYSGLLLAYVNYFQVGFPVIGGYRKATFDGLRNGIIAYNTVLDIGGDMRNLVGENIGGNPFFPIGGGDFSHSGIGVFSVNSSGLSLSNSIIENAYRGIYARHVDINDISQNTFTNVNTGIEVIKNEGNTIHIGGEGNDRNDIYCREAGILINESNRCDINITNNYIFREAGSTSPMLGIGVYNTILDLENSGNVDNNGGIADIFNNHIELTNFDLVTIDKGIEIMNSAFVKVKQNSIWEVDGSGAKHFISLLGNYGHTQIRNNEGFSFSPSPSNALGMNIVNNTHTTYCCNSFIGIDQGVRFSGMSDDTQFRGTWFGNINTRGLLLEQGTTIGVQGNPNTSDYLPGNKWSANGGGAEHMGTFAEIDQSLIYYDQNINGSYPVPDPIPNSDWFVPDPNINDPLPTIDCFVNLDCEIDELNIIDDDPIDEVDIKIADGTLSSGHFGGGVHWEGQRHLYRKLEQNNQLLSQNSIIHNFHSINETTSLGQLYEIDREVSTLYHSNNSVVQSIMIQRQSVRTLLHLIQEKDSLIMVSPEDTHTGIKAEQAVLINELSVLNEALYNLLTSFNSDKQSIVNNILNLNNSISSQSIFEQNRLSVNDIYLNTIAGDIFELNTTQFQSLKMIAEQCPLSGGNAVFQARGILKAIGDNTYYDNELICTPAQQKSEVYTEKEMIAEQLEVYPNPTKDIITIAFDGSLKSDLEFKLYDVSGKQIQVFTLAKGQKEYTLNLANTTKGLYFYECKMNRQVYKGKIVLMK